jgi:hypothetical protein
MTGARPRSPIPLRNVLYELALAKPVPDAALVDEFVRRYPEFASDLTEYAIALALNAIAAQNEPVDKPSAVTTPSVSRAMSRFHNRLYAVRKETDAEAAKVAPAVENPFSKLTTSTREHGLRHEIARPAHPPGDNDGRLPTSYSR